jgi:CRISPR-associated protein Cmr3
MIIEINPLDTLFFRDGKPFNMGEEVWADGIFPPPPSVIYGALRTAYFAEHGGIEKANTEEDPTKDLEIKGIYLKIDETLHLPLPLDCVKEKDDEDGRAFELEYKKSDGIISSCPVDDLLTPEEKDIKIENIDGGIFSWGQFESYINRNCDSEYYFLKLTDYALSEPKTGIGRKNETHSSQESNLYRVGMRRLESKMEFQRQTESLSIIIDFCFGKDKNIPETGFLKLGGEGKAVEYKCYDDEIKAPELNKNFQSGTIFKLYLSTPVVFKKGWIPDFIDEDNLKGNYNNTEVKLLTACVGKPISIGGFDMKARKPKTMRKAIPAGSVYYFKILEGSMQINSSYQGKIVENDLSKEGFGICYLGGIK